MQSLHGLRTNCLLAPLSCAILGAIAILIAWRWQVAAVAASDATAHRSAITGLAQLHEQGAGVPLAAWLKAHPGWEGISRCILAGDRLETLDAAGTTRPGAEPEPDLVLAFQEARTWTSGGRSAAAAPCLLPDQQPSIIVGWWQPAPPGPAWPWLALATGVLLIGGGLGAYLVARVYRPVRWLEQAALAAASGAPEPGGRIESMETASLRSSLITILAKAPHEGERDSP